VLFTGLTVAVCLAGVTVFPDAFLRSMGIAGEGVFGRLATLVQRRAVLTLLGQRRAVLTLLGTAGLLVLLVAPALHMRLSNSDARALPASTATRQLYAPLQRLVPVLSDQLEMPTPPRVVAP
jgi:RND superfamily putative drug exporter